MISSVSRRILHLLDALLIAKDLSMYIDIQPSAPQVCLRSRFGYGKLATLSLSLAILLTALDIYTLWMVPILDIFGQYGTYEFLIIFLESALICFSLDVYRKVYRSFTLWQRYR